MNEFILITIVLSKDLSTFEIRVPKKTYKKCIEDSKTYKFPFEELHKVTSVKTRFKKVIGKQRQLENDKSI